MQDENFWNKFFQKLNKTNIEYCVLEWNQKENFLDIYIKSEFDKEFLKLIKAEGMIEDKSKNMEYSYIYKLRPDRYFVLDSKITIHSANQMSCVSLSNLSKCKLPLDNSIQISLWENKKWNEKFNFWMISEEDRFINLITKSIFNEKCFNKENIDEIRNCKVDFHSQSLKKKLEGVFFLFTPDLLRYIQEGKYDIITHKYKTFCKY